MTVVAAVSTDNDAERIIREAASLATALGEDLHVVHVREYSELKDSAESDATIDRRSVTQQVEDTAARIAAPITDEFTPVGLIGKPASKIVSHAKSVDSTYLVIGGKKQSPVGKAIFGSTTQQILLNAPCPVVTTMLVE